MHARTHTKEKNNEKADGDLAIDRCINTMAKQI